MQRALVIRQNDCTVSVLTQGGEEKDVSSSEAFPSGGAIVLIADQTVHAWCRDYSLEFFTVTGRTTLGFSLSSSSKEIEVPQSLFGTAPPSAEVVLYRDRTGYL